MGTSDRHRQKIETGGGAELGEPTRKLPGAETSMGMGLCFVLIAFSPSPLDPNCLLAIPPKGELTNPGLYFTP